MKNKIFITSISLIILGIISLFIENTFYQYLDEEGFLHESLFLPLGIFSLIIGIIFFILYCCIKSYKRFFKQV